MTEFYRHEMRGYDAWLSAPYEKRYAREAPADFENYADLEFWLDGERVKVTDYEEWMDADEDGKHYGVDLIVTGPSGRTENLPIWRLEEVLADQDNHRDEDEEVNK